MLSTPLLVGTSKYLPVCIAISASRDEPEGGRSNTIRSNRDDAITFSKGRANASGPLSAVTR